jgi:hypothetical protein
MSISLRWMLITLAVFGASARSQAMTPRLAVLATAQSFGQDHETSPVPAGGPECPACCETSSWLRQMTQRIPYVNRLFAVPLTANRAALKVGGETTAAQPALATAETGDWLARARAEVRVTTPSTVWAIQVVGRPTTTTAPCCGGVQACCGVGGAVADRVMPACGTCAKSCDGCSDAAWPVPPRTMTFQAGPLAPFTMPVPFGVPAGTCQVCPTEPVAPPIATWLQQRIPAMTQVQRGFEFLPTAPQVQVQLVQTSATTMVPATPPALKMQASQVNLSTSQMDISADRMQHVGDDVLLEGNVRIVLKRGGGEPVRVTAARVVVNLRDNSFRVGQAVPTPAPAQASFATERVIYQVEPTAPAQPSAYQGPTRTYYMLPVHAAPAGAAPAATPSAAPVPLQFSIPMPR